MARSSGNGTVVLGIIVLAVLAFLWYSHASPAARSSSVPEELPLIGPQDASSDKGSTLSTPNSALVSSVFPFDVVFEPASDTKDLATRNVHSTGSNVSPAIQLTNVHMDGRGWVLEQGSIMTMGSIPRTRRFSFVAAVELETAEGVQPLISNSAWGERVEGVRIFWESPADRFGQLRRRLVLEISDGRAWLRVKSAERIVNARSPPRRHTFGLSVDMDDPYGSDISVFLDGVRQDVDAIEFDGDLSSLESTVSTAGEWSIGGVRGSPHKTAAGTRVMLIAFHGGMMTHDDHVRVHEFLTPGP